MAGFFAGGASSSLESSLLLDAALAAAALAATVLAATVLAAFATTLAAARTGRRVKPLLDAQQIPS